MQSEVNLLILTAGFGSGHIAVAKAIKEQVAINQPEITTEIVDIYKLLNPLKYKMIYRGYEIFVKLTPGLYNWFYSRKNKENSSNTRKKLASRKLLRLKAYLKNKNPKAILSVFPECTAIIADYKDQFNSELILMTCITDLVTKKEWLYKKNDIYFLGTQEQKQILVDKGYHENSLFVTGIPVRKQFYINKDKICCRRELKIKNEDKVFMLMGGGYGIFPKEESFYRWLLDKGDTILVALTSNNKRIYNILYKLKMEYKDRIRLYKFCRQVPEYMKASDYLIGKSGGVTLFEAILSELPIIVYQPRLGQEIENSKYIIENNIGYISENTEELKRLIDTIINSELVNVENQGIKQIKSIINIELMSDTIRKAVFFNEKEEKYAKGNNCGN